MFNYFIVFQVWSGHLGKPIITVGKEELGPAVSIAISPQQDVVAIGYHSGVIKVHDVQTGKGFGNNILL